MRALLIGCGQGGSKMTEAIMKMQHATFGNDIHGKPIKKQFDAIVINTTPQDLEDVDKKFIDGKRQLLIGTGYTYTSGHGAGGNPRLGTHAANHDALRIAAKIEEILLEINKNPDMNDVDAIFVISALGGGSGSGMGPVIAQILKDYYFENQYPVIGIVTLPAKQEGRLPTYNGFISLQSWLKESNFEGIITISLGGKFLFNMDDSLRYYSKFNKSVAKAIYILFGGDSTGTRSSKNVDVNDILSTIKEGGGLCTLGHFSTDISGPAGADEERDEVLLTYNDFSDDVKGWKDLKLLKSVVQACNKNNLFLPVDFRTARTALLVFKDSESFEITREAAQQSANWLEKHIEGNVRHSDISHKNFKLKADNSVVKGLYEDYEIDPNTDIPLSNNESVEISLLLSGIRDVHLVQGMKKVAEEVLKFSNPPRGERLLAETLGIPIGEKINRTMLLPCSDLRDNIAAQIQSRAIREALDEFIEDHTRLDPLIIPEYLRKNVKVTDVRPIPDVLQCGKTSSARTETNCFEIDVRFDNNHDNTHFVRTYGVHIKPFETKRLESGNRITWDVPEYLFKKPGWNDKEKQIISDVSRTLDENKQIITGLGRYPYCNGFSQNQVYRIRTLVCSSEKREWNLEYLLWLAAHPEPIILEYRVLKDIEKSGKWTDAEPLFDTLYEKEDEIPSYKKIKDTMDKLGFPDVIKKKISGYEENQQLRVPCEDKAISSDTTYQEDDEDEE